MERTAVSTFETDKRQIYIVGGGIAGLSAAVFAIRDGHIPGNNVHIFETTNVMGGALDGTGSADTYYVCRGARKVNYEVFNCMWGVLSAILSLTDPHMTVKDEVFEYNRIHKKNAKSRLIDKDRNKIDIPKYGPMGLSWGDRIRCSRSSSFQKAGSRIAGSTRGSRLRSSRQISGTSSPRCLLLSTGTTWSR